VTELKGNVCVTHNFDGSALDNVSGAPWVWKPWLFRLQHCQTSTNRASTNHPSPNQPIRARAQPMPRDHQSIRGPGGLPMGPPHAAAPSINTIAAQLGATYGLSADAATATALKLAAADPSLCRSLLSNELDHASLEQLLAATQMRSAGGGAGGSAGPGPAAAAPQQQFPPPLAPNGLLVHDFEFCGVELLKPTRMNKAYLVFACSILEQDLMFVVYNIPTVGICRAEQRVKACQRLGINYADLAHVEQMYVPAAIARGAGVPPPSRGGGAAAAAGLPAIAAHGGGGDSDDGSSEGERPSIRRKRRSGVARAGGFAAGGGSVEDGGSGEEDLGRGGGGDAAARAQGRGAPPLPSPFLLPPGHPLHSGGSVNAEDQAAAAAAMLGGLPNNLLGHLQGLGGFQGLAAQQAAIQQAAMQQAAMQQAAMQQAAARMQQQQGAMPALPFFQAAAFPNSQGLVVRPLSAFGSLGGQQSAPVAAGPMGVGTLDVDGMLAEFEEMIKSKAAAGAAVGSGGGAASGSGGAAPQAHQRTRMALRGERAGRSGAVDTILLYLVF
jgi:hypothetical protein